MRPVIALVTLGDGQLHPKILRLELSEELFAHQQLLLVMSYVHKPEQEEFAAGFAALVGQSLRVELEDATVPADESTGPVLLFDGVITRATLAYEPSGLQLEVTAASGSTGLDAVPRTRLFQETTLQGLLDELLSDYTGGALEAVNVHLGSLGNKRIEFAAQWSETDWAFLLRVARKLGLLVAARSRDLHIHAADPWEALTGLESQIELLLGGNLSRFRVGLAGAEAAIQACSYQHFGEQGLEAGSADSLEEVRVWTGPREAVQPASPLAQLAPAGAGPEGQVTEIDDYFSQQELDAIAARWARARIAGMVSGGGTADAVGLSLGAVLNIAPAATRTFDALAGDRFLVTRCRHRVEGSAYEAEFDVCADGAPPLQDPADLTGAPDARLMSASVTDACDPSNIGRVKVRFYPYVNAELGEIWVRCLVDAAGHDHGTLSLPELHDEVVLVFDPRAFQAPVLVGAAYNGAHKTLVADLPSAFSLTAEMLADNNLKYFRTKAGTLVIHDCTPDAARLIIATPTASIVLSEAAPASIDIQVGGQACQITAVDDGSLTIKAKNISIEAEESLTLKSGTQTEVEAGSAMKLKAGGDLSAKSDANVKIEAGANYEMKASMQAKAEASVGYEIKGGVSLKLQAVKIDLN